MNHRKREEELWKEIDRLALWSSAIAILLLTLAYFLVPNFVQNTLIRDFLLGIITNLIPVFLLFALSYVFLRRIQTIRSERDTENLVRKITNTVRSILVDTQLSSQDDTSTTDKLKSADKEVVTQVVSLRSENADLRATVTFLEQISVHTGLQSVQESIEAISNLFLVRDKSVLSRDNKSFIETQLNKEEIAKGSSSAYLTCSKMTTSILKIVSPRSASYPNISSSDYCVLVREDYERDFKFSHSAYINYHLLKIDNTLKISSLQSLKY